MLIQIAQDKKPFMGGGPAHRGHVRRMSQSLSDVVYQEMRDQILWGEISPGTVLSLRALAQQFGVSTMPVRDALRRLAIEELVEIAPRSSTRVPEISVERVREIFEVRTRLEPLAAGLACTNLTPAEVKLLGSYVEKQALATSRNRPRDWQRWNKDFHHLIFRTCGNSFLQHLTQEIWQRCMHHFSIRSVVDPEFCNRRAAEHMRIVKAFERRDCEAAEATWRDHMMQSGVETVRYLRMLVADMKGEKPATRADRRERVGRGQRSVGQ